MDLQTVTTLISSVGFPIAMCLLMFWRQQKSDEMHRDEMDKMRQSFDGNTHAIQQLTVEIEKFREK